MRSILVYYWVLSSGIVGLSEATKFIVFLKCMVYVGVTYSLQNGLHGMFAYDLYSLVPKTPGKGQLTN